MSWTGDHLWEGSGGVYGQRQIPAVSVLQTYLYGVGVAHHFPCRWRKYTLMGVKGQMRWKLCSVPGVQNTHEKEETLMGIILNYI
jgi:hypothetical protein